MIFLFDYILFVFCNRKVHISESCKEELGEVFETEPGFGSERSELLKSRNIKTFLIVSPAQVIYTLFRLTN